MNTLHARLIADYCKRPELDAMLLDERLAYFAMHEAEKWMHEDVYRGYEYDMKLRRVVKAYDGIGEPCNHMRLYHATAA
jgi:hypothetical protein